MNKEQEMNKRIQRFKERLQEIKKIPADLEYTQEQMKVRQKARSLNLKKPFVFKKLYEKQKQQKEKDLQNAEKDTKNILFNINFIKHDEVNNIIKPNQNIKSKTQKNEIQQKKEVTKCNPQPSIDINKQDINVINKRTKISLGFFKQKKKQQNISTLDNHKVTDMEIKKEAQTNMKIKNVRIEEQIKSQVHGLQIMGKQLGQKKNDADPKTIFLAPSINNEQKKSFGKSMHKIGRSTMRISQQQDNKVNPQSSIDNQNLDRKSEIKVESIKEEKKISSFLTSIRKTKTEEIPKRKVNFYIRAFASQDQNIFKRQIPQNSYNIFISQQQQNKQNPQ